MFSASIVTYKTPDDELRGCLESLSGSGVSEVYVIDNSGSQATHRLCNDFPQVRYISSANIGYGAAHNIAMRRSLDAGKGYHLVLNPDVLFAPTSVRALVDYMESNRDVGMVQPKIVNPDGLLQYTVRRLPTPFDVFIRRFLPKSWFAGRRMRYELRNVDHEKPFNVPYHQGSFMLLRCGALKETGLFDERFFMYPEDIDLTRRIHEKYRTMYSPLATVVHAHRAESYHNRRMTWIHIKNMILYFNKWGWIFDKKRSEFNRRLDSL